MNRLSRGLGALALFAVMGGLLIAVPAGAAAPKDEDGTLTVSKTVLNAQGQPLTTLPAGEFKINVTCHDDHDKELFAVTIVFDQTGTIKTLPANWTADVTNKIATYHQGAPDDLANQLCTANEDATSSALSGNGAVTTGYACTAGGTDVSVIPDVSSTVAPDPITFGCKSDRSGQFTTKNDPVGSCTANEVGPPTAAVPA